MSKGRKRQMEKRRCFKRAGEMYDSLLQAGRTGRRIVKKMKITKAECLVSVIGG